MQDNARIPEQLDGVELPDDTDQQRILEVNNVLDWLDVEYPMKDQIEELRFSGGMQNEGFFYVLREDGSPPLAICQGDALPSHPEKFNQKECPFRSVIDA